MRCQEVAREFQIAAQVVERRLEVHLPQPTEIRTVADFAGQSAQPGQTVLADCFGAVA